jgi:predicted dinucleotide-binding enzyme
MVLAGARGSSCAAPSPSSSAKAAITTTIGIIGSGHVGSSLARAAIAHGYDVVLSNSQGPDSLAGLVRDLGPRVRAGTPGEAAAAGDFVIVAIPITTIDQVPAEPLAGKVVIATINYFPQRTATYRRSTAERPRCPGCCRRICRPARSCAPSA